jgi:DNA-binding MarR family transcriptional regulator
MRDDSREQAELDDGFKRSEGPGAVSPSIPIQRYDLKILQSLRAIIRGVDIHSRRLVGTHDITSPQLICLITITEHGPITQKQIAERVFLSPSTVVGILDRLESKGLVLRARDTRDRRLVNVTATATGRKLVANAPSPLQDGLACALKNLPEIEQATIALSLQRIVDLMDVEALDAAPVLDMGETLSERGASGEKNKRS